MTAAETLPGKRDVLRRSWLYVPLHEQKFVNKAVGLNPDAIILDLQDGVPDSRKDEARGRLAGAAASLRRRHDNVFVRLNPGAMRWTDLDACIAGGVDQVLVSMAESVTEVEEIGRRLRAGCAGPRRPEMALSLESARAILDARALAACDPSVSTIIAGTEDLAWDLGVEPGEALRQAKLSVVLAAAAEGVFASGVLGHLRSFRDPEATERLAREAYRFGFQGCSCIHPSQVGPFNRGFSPTEEEVARAKALIAAYEAKTGSAGAVGIDGEMTDGPVVGRARKVVADHEKRLRADARMAAAS